MSENISDRVGAMVRRYRKRAGLSQEALALSANMGASFIGDVERGRKKPSIDSLEKILAVLGVSFEEFFSFTENLKPKRESEPLIKLSKELNNLTDGEINAIYNIVRQIIFLRDSEYKK